MKTFVLCKLHISVLAALCFVGPANAGNWNKPKDAHTSFGRVIEHKEHPGGFVTYPGRWELPQELDPHPNDQTVSLHYERWLSEITRGPLTTINPSLNPSMFNFELRSSEYLTSHLATSNVLSYLFYENGKIIYDELAPAGRYSFEVSDRTEFRSNSIGKSFVSYLLGNAICEGYIASVDETLSDWPIMRNTLYENQSLINFLNMRAGDHLVVTESQGFIASGRWFNSFALSSFAENELKNTKPQPAKYNYNGFVTNLLMNYVHFKTGENWQSLLDKVFKERVKIGRRLVFQQAGSYKPTQWYSAYASRYDYLRIARAMMEDWQNNTCVGRYLKEVYERRKPKGRDATYFSGETPRKMPFRREIWARTYGGQFHFDYIGMEDRPIIGMDGYGGQSILIDPSESRIIVLNSAHTNYNWYELMYAPMLTGKIRHGN
jgi:CubicO group peptidase (beta-lactamase class C family)